MSMNPLALAIVAAVSLILAWVSFISFDDSSYPVAQFLVGILFVIAAGYFGLSAIANALISH